LQFRGDTVVVRSGRDAGKSGKVKRVMHKQHRLVVTGLNSIKRAVKPTEASVGGIIAVESPIHYSRVSLLDPSDGCVDAAAAAVAAAVIFCRCRCCVVHTRCGGLVLPLRPLLPLLFECDVSLPA
jgi:ribosomal protein L24